MNVTVRHLSLLLLATGLLLAGCGSPKPVVKEKLIVAAAANLTGVLDEIGQAFKAKSGNEVIISYGATAQLAKQIEHGAPFDLFASADVQHIDELVANKKLTADSRAVYALGQLALWIPAGEASGIHELKDLAAKKVKFVAIAQPDLAPYGAASVEVLKRTNLWEGLQPKIVYGGSISQAKQLATSGNADAAFTAYSLVLKEKGTVLKIDRSQYTKIEQALGIVAASPRIPEAQQFREFLIGKEGRAILERSGYLLP
jgi:molybdate transport system substrate-binding protein